MKIEVEIGKQSFVCDISGATLLDGGPPQKVMVQQKEYSIFMHRGDLVSHCEGLETRLHCRSVVVNPDNSISAQYATGRQPLQNAILKVGFFIPPELKKSFARLNSGTTNLKSPMTGKVLQIFVSEGQNVQAGTVLLTIEAMKMENKIQAPRTGLVKKIKVNPGQLVQVGHELLVIDAV